MSQHFSVRDENPNQVHGTNGCLCADDGTSSTEGPFIVFNATEMDNTRSPFPVLCAGCAEKAFELLAVPAEVVEPPAPKRSSRSKAADEDGPAI